MKKKRLLKSAEQEQSRGPIGESGSWRVHVVVFMERSRGRH